MWNNMKNKELGVQKKNPKKSEKRKYIRYSYKLKRKIVSEITKGKLSINQAKIKYGIESNSIIYAWRKKYGNLVYSENKNYTMKQSPEERIKELKKQIEELEMDKDILLTYNYILETEFGVDVKKHLPEQLKKDYKSFRRNMDKSKR